MLFPKNTECFKKFHHSSQPSRMRFFWQGGDHITSNFRTIANFEGTGPNNTVDLSKNVDFTSRKIRENDGAIRARTCVPEKYVGNQPELCKFPNVAL
jgi:hypothetical protein